MNELFNKFPQPTEEEQYLETLAAEYHRRAEAYDRTVCTGPILHGSIMPNGSHEMALVNRNAIVIRRELEERAFRERGIDRACVRKAINNYDK